MSVEEIIRIVNTGGVVGVLIFILYGGSRAKPWWVFGREYERMAVELAEWRQAALQGTALSRRAVEVAKEHDLEQRP